MFFVFNTVEIRSLIPAEIKDEASNARVEIRHSYHFDFDGIGIALKHTNDCEVQKAHRKEKAMIEIGYQKHTLQKHARRLTRLAVRKK